VVLIRAVTVAAFELGDRLEVEVFGEVVAGQQGAGS
jgi:hypothetical protein